MQGRNRGTDLQNRLVNTVEEREGGTNGESRIDIHTAICKTDGWQQPAV